jgi:NTE family protein
MNMTRQHNSLVLVMVLMSALSLTGCASVPPAVLVDDPPQETLPSFTFSKHPVIAFALSSGATRGFAHVGVLNVLEEHGIRPDLIVGTSAGAVTGVLYAGGIRGTQLEDIANHLQREQIADWSYSGRGLIRGEILQNTINELLQNRPIERLETPFAATATDLVTGRQVVFSRGDAGLAVRASSSIPGLVSPVTINGRDYVDGGLVSKVPARLARRLGADFVIAVDVSRRPEDHTRLDTTIEVMQQAYAIMARVITARDLSGADFVIRPKLGDFPLGDLRHKQEAIEAGKEAARAAVPSIKRRLQDRYNTYN